MTDARIHLDWADACDNVAGRLLFDAVNTHEALGKLGDDPVVAARTKAEVNGLIRALALLIDAPLYADRYVRLRGSAVWGQLWDDVTAIVTEPCIGHGERAARMQALVAGWPARCGALLAEPPGPGVTL
jgi:hypothetical protein